MKSERRKPITIALVALAIPMAVGISACGENNPAQQAIEDQKQKLQDQATEAINQQKELATQQAQDALDQATGKANEAIDQAQQQINESVPSQPSR